MKKRMLTMLLCLVMVFAALPLQVFASNNEGTGNSAHQRLIDEMARMDKADTTEVDLSKYPGLANRGISTFDVGDRKFYEVEPNNSKATADTIYNNYTVCGYLTSSDLLDYFKFTLNTRSRVRLIYAADYGFMTGIWNSADECIAADTSGSYSSGSYIYNITETLDAGTYYIGNLDRYATYNVYVFYIEIEPLAPIKPAAPVVKVSNRVADGKPTVTWNAVSGAKEYEVYRSTSQNGTYQKVATTTKTSYVNTGAKTGTAYYYQVKTVGTNGAVSDASKSVGVRCDLSQPKVTITNVASSGKIKLSWNKIDSAKEYKVYRATSQNGAYKLVKTTTSNSYINTTAKEGTTYYYKVMAIHKNSSANSAYSTVVSRACDLARPEVTIKLSSTGKPRLTWKAVTGAKEYKVYRATSPNGTYTLMKTATSTSYTNTSAKKGTTYYYKVQAVHTKSAANSAVSTVSYIKSK